MQFIYMFFQFIGIGLLSLIIANSGVANTLSKKNKTNRLEQYQQIDWSKYTVAALKKKVPKKIHGQDISLLPVQSLYFIPASNIIEMNRAWKAIGRPWPKTIVLANGVYNLEKINQLISNPKVFKKINDKTYISYRSIYIAPTATLVINNKELRLSISDGVFVIANGKIFATDSILTTWDKIAKNYGVRKKIPKNQLLFYGNQFPRPYFLMLNGSEFYAANSIFRGLGYKGQTGSFGFAMNYGLPLMRTHTVIADYLKALKRPTGWLIGNTFDHSFFGYYSNGAKDVVIVGNIYLNSLIYNIDPHDYSSNLLIARNLSYKAKHSHGIIVSREVNNSTIAENLSLRNNGSGIMLDRNSEHNLIYNNLVMENQGDGIAIFESDNNEINRNIIARNQHNGIFIRNSCSIKIQSNKLFRNIKSGSEISVVNIDMLETRNFVLDPYHKLAKATLLSNTFDSNLGSAINSKNKPGVRLKENIFYNSGASYFSGDIQTFNRDILFPSKDKEFKYNGINSCQ